MTQELSSSAEERILTLAPTGADAEWTKRFLCDAGMQAENCHTLIALVDKLYAGCGGIVIAEEGFDEQGLHLLGDALKNQPAWSDIPVVIVVGKGNMQQMRSRLISLGAFNLTLLERPVHPMVLTSSLQVALRARRRQYQTRDLLRQREADLVSIRQQDEELKRAQCLLAEQAENLEQVVLDRTASLKETAEQLETFCYTVAHDLRAPLRAQQGYSYALLENYGLLLDDTAKHYLRRIIASADRLDRLVADLLTYARVSREEFKLQKVDLGKVVPEALLNHESEIQHKKAKITTPKVFPLVQGHEATLKLAVGNLVSNALKFTAAGQRPQIRFFVKNNSSVVRLFIEDKGIGIAPEHYRQIFGIFQRLHKNEYPGTGIGLALVAKAVQRMKGTLGVESQPGKGSKFWIELPRAA